MKIIKSFGLALVILMGANRMLQAQSYDTLLMPYFDKYYGFGPMVSLPLSNRSFIDKTSLRGARFFYREMLNEYVSAGLDLSYAGYNDYTPPAVYTSPGSAVYTDLYSYVDQYAVSVSGEYNFSPYKRFMPYVGFGLGAAHTNIRLYYNIYDDAESKWSVLIRPYAGLMMRFSKRSSWGAFANVLMDYSTLRAPDYDYKGFSSVALQAGIVYLNW
jgi:opacity protein-like surface antigen